MNISEKTLTDPKLLHQFIHDFLRIKYPALRRELIRCDACEKFVSNYLGTLLSIPIEERRHAFACLNEDATNDAFIDVSGFFTFSQSVEGWEYWERIEQNIGINMQISEYEHE